MTTLSPELQQVAQDFGLALHQHEAVQQYLQAVANLKANTDSVDLDQRFETVYADLVARQHAGEDLPSDEVHAFYALRKAVATDPLIETRDYALNIVKGYLANIGADLNRALELDYVTIVLS